MASKISWYEVPAPPQRLEGKIAWLIPHGPNRDTSRVADKYLEKGRNGQVGQVLKGSFSWSDMLDATADVYLGVSWLYTAATLRQY